MTGSGTLFFCAAVGCATLSLAAIVAEQWRVGRGFRLHEPRLFLAVLNIVALYYALGANQSASGNRAALTFLGGMACGSFPLPVLLCMQARQRAKLVACGLVGLMLSAVAVSLYPETTHETMHYLGKVRWSGPWSDPNLYGCFVALGVVVGIALINVVVLRWLRATATNEKGGRYHWRWTVAALLVLLFGLALTARALLNSYSRGAWLACIAGGGLLCWRLGALIAAEPQFIRIKGRVGRDLPWFGTSIRLSCLIVLAVGAGFYGQLKALPLPWMSRAFSVTNHYDLSLRNRISAWQGGLQMMAAHAPHGVGWGDVRAIYDDYHRPLHIKNPGAIETNDYLMIGCILGLPGLLCLGGYAVGSLHAHKLGLRQAPLRREQRVAEFADHGFFDFGECIPPIFQAIAVTLLCAAGTNGIIFTWPLGALLWCALAVSRLGVEEENVGRSAMMHSSVKPRPAIKHGMKEGARWLGGLLIFGVLLYWLGTLSEPRIEWRGASGIAGDETYALTTTRGVMDRLITYVSLGDRAAATPGSDARRMARVGLPILAAGRPRMASAVPPECTPNGWLEIRKVFRIGSTVRPAWLIRGEWRPELVKRLLPLLKETGAPCVYVVDKWEEPTGTESQPVEVEAEPRVRSDAMTEVAAESTRQAGRFLILCHQPIPADAAEQMRQQVARWSGGHIMAASSRMEGDMTLATRGAYLRRIVEAVLDVMGSEIAARAPSKERAAGWKWTRAISIAAWFVGTVAAIRLGLTRLRGDIPAGLAASVAIVLLSLQIGIHWLLPLMPASRATIWLAGRLLVANEMKADWAWLTHESSPHLQTIAEYSDNMRLASLEQNSYYDMLEHGMYRRFLLSIAIDDLLRIDSEWRVEMWQAISPWSKQSRNAREGTRVVGLILREHLTVKRAAGKRSGTTISEMWQGGLTDEKGFQRLYVAALRSVGIAARLDADRHAEFWTGERWEGTPKPMFVEEH